MRAYTPIVFVSILLLAYALFKAPGVVFGVPVPSSLVTMYMLFTVVVLLLSMTSTTEGARRLLAPVAGLASMRSLPGVGVRLAAALLLSAFVYWFIASPDEPPGLARVVHPAPPRSIEAYGKVFDLENTVNPFRVLKESDPAAYATVVRDGGYIYFENCFFCHGDKLDGRGHYARAMEPAPLPFTGSDTIAQLEESYVFWRIVKGGRGLPKESAPWLSAMPAWERRLDEDQVWKVILFIYEQSGNTPRMWQED